MNFRLLDIPVTIHPSFWLFLAYVAFISGSFDVFTCIQLAVIFGSILFHEYGHALTALVFGQRPSIHILAFGGYASFNGIGLTRKQQYWITLNGPMATLFLISASYGCLKMGLFTDGLVRYGLATVLRLNFFFLAANLLPLFPLDGGRLLRHVLETRLGVQQGTRVSLMVGNVAAVIGALYFFLTENYVFGSLFVFHGMRNWQLFQQTDFPPREKPTPHKLYQEGMKAMVSDDLPRAKTVFKRLLRQQDKQFQTAAMEGLATILDKEGAKKEAYHLLLKADPAYLKRGKWLLCQLAYDQQNYALIDTHSRDIYSIHPAFETALLISKAYAHLKRPEESGGWMHTASLFEEVSKQSLKDLLTDRIYDPVRDDPKFQEYAHKINLEG